MQTRDHQEGVFGADISIMSITVVVGTVLLCSILTFLIWVSSVLFGNYTFINARNKGILNITHRSGTGHQKNQSHWVRDGDILLINLMKTKGTTMGCCPSLLWITVAALHFSLWLPLQVLCLSFSVTYLNIIQNTQSIWISLWPFHTLWSGHCEIPI